VRHELQCYPAQLSNELEGQVGNGILSRSRILAIVSVSALLAACGSDNSGETADTTGGTNDTQGTVPASPPTEVEEPTRLRVASPAPNAGWDPHLVASSAASIAYLYPVYDRLLQFNVDMDVEPMLAESYEYSDDLLTLTMKLRTDVSFHDGASFDAEVAKANVERAKRLLPPGSQISLEAVTAVEATDPETLVIQLSEPDPSLLTHLAGFAGAMISPNVVDQEDIQTLPSGSGPYQPVLEDTTEITAVLQKVDSYWGVPAGADRMEISGVSDALTRLNGFRAGDFDVAVLAGGVIAGLKEEVENAGGQYHLYDGFFSLTLAMNPSTHPALADPRVRRALSLAIDRDSIADDLLGGDCSANAQMMADGVVGYEPELATTERDLDQARALLEEAGNPVLSFDIVAPAVDPWQSLPTVIQSQWADLDVDVSIEVKPPAEAPSAFRDQGMNFYAQNLRTGPLPGIVASDYVTRTPLPDDLPETVRQMITDASLLDPNSAEAGKLYTQINRALSEEPFHLWICNMTTVVVAADGVTGADGLPWARNSAVIDPTRLGIAS
jgi:ABC-type transport system substrate-binding protein